MKVLVSFEDKFSCSWGWGCSVWCEHLLHSVFLICRVAQLEEGWGKDFPGWSLLLALPQNSPHRQILF